MFSLLSLSKHSNLKKRFSLHTLVTSISVLVALPLAVNSTASANSLNATELVMFVGNNWDGTVTVIEPSGDYAQVGRLNAIPDYQTRIWEIAFHPIRLGYFLGIRHSVGEGNDQYVDDMYSTPDGKSLVISRPSFADVVSIDMQSGEVNWRFPVEGFRADHMAVSPDGTEVAVSSSTANVVHLLNIYTGEEVGRFETGDKPHENTYIDDGRFIINASIGEVNTDLDAPWLDFTKGDRKLTIYDRHAGEVAYEIDMRDRLNDAGRDDLSDSIRPYTLSPDENTLYFQVSFFNGVVEYDMLSDKITRVIELPEGAAPSDRKEFVNDSRHHGLSISPDGSKLCVAGTMDEYATIVDVETGEAGPLIEAGKPYWATVSADGTACVISESDTDVVTVIDFETGNKLMSVDVGNHPQRVRLGSVPVGWTGPAN